jgi:hypothetical protein
LTRHLTVPVAVVAADVEEAMEDTAEAVVEVAVAMVVDKVSFLHNILFHSVPDMCQAAAMAVGVVVSPASKTFSKQLLTINTGYGGGGGGSWNNQQGGGGGGYAPRGGYGGQGQGQSYGGQEGGQGGGGGGQW